MGLIEEASRTLVDKIADQLLLRLMRDPYVENVWEDHLDNNEGAPPRSDEDYSPRRKRKTPRPPLWYRLSLLPLARFAVQSGAFSPVTDRGQKNVETKVTFGPEPNAPWNWRSRSSSRGCPTVVPSANKPGLLWRKPRPPPGPPPIPAKGPIYRGTGAGGQIHLPIPPRPMAPWE